MHDPGLNLLEAALNPDPNPLKDDGTIVISEDSALLAEGGIDSGNVGNLAAPDEDTALVVKKEQASAPAKKAEAPKAAPKPAPKAAPKPAAKPAAKAATTKAKTVAKTAAVSGYFSNPCPACHKSQGLHGHNGIDLAGPNGSPIYAAAAGKVTTVKGGSAWNGGYGNYVIVSHSNGCSTLYAHMSRIATSGGSVAKGQLIGYVGSTGESTGNHLHIETHGCANPF